MANSERETQLDGTENGIQIFSTIRVGRSRRRLPVISGHSTTEGPIDVDRLVLEIKDLSTLRSSFGRRGRRRFQSSLISSTF